MAIKVKTEFTREGTVRIICYVYDDDEELVDATSVSVSVKDPDRTMVVDDQVMSNPATGTYEYYYETTTSVVEGDYQVECAILDGSYISHAQGHFNMVKGINE